MWWRMAEVPLQKKMLRWLLALAAIAMPVTALVDMLYFPNANLSFIVPATTRANARAYEEWKSVVYAAIARGDAQGGSPGHTRDSAADVHAGIALQSRNVVTTGSTTVGEPTWNRPVENGALPPFTLSLVGTAVPYLVIPLSLNAASTLTVLCTGVTPLNWDNYSFLYTQPFNP